jgi:small subunit ribosomal protein S2
MKEKLLKNLEGIKEIRGLPKAVFVVDPTIDHNAVAEARKLNIPVFGITDTNCDPDLVDYPIPGNDDAIGSVRLIVQTIADAIVEAKGGVTVVAYTKDEDFIAKIAALKEATKPQERTYGPRPEYRSSNSTYTPSSQPATTAPVTKPTPTPVAPAAPVAAAPAVDKKPRAPRKPKIEAKEE